MAIKEMLPYRDDIIAMKQPPNVRTHEEVIAYLEQTYHLKVSAPTVTRFLRLHAPHLVNSRNLTEDEEKTAMPFQAFLRVEAEIIAMREELGLQIDTLTERTGGKLAVLSAEIGELEKVVMDLKLSQSDNGSENIAKEAQKEIWIRAYLVSGSICAALFTVLWFILRN